MGTDVTMRKMDNNFSSNNTIERHSNDHHDNNYIFNKVINIRGGKERDEGGAEEEEMFIQ